MVGKSLGTDLANGKLTLPVLLALERSVALDRAELQKLIEQWEGGNLARVVGLLDKYDALDGSRGVIHQFLERARLCLASLPETESRLALIALTGFLEQQTSALGV